MTEEKKEKEGRNRDRRPSARQVLEKSGSFFASGAALVVCQLCTRRIADKDGDERKVAAARSSSEREQMSGGSHMGGSSQKEKTGLK